MAPSIKVICLAKTAYEVELQRLPVFVLPAGEDDEDRLRLLAVNLL